MLTHIGEFDRIILGKINKITSLVEIKLLIRNQIEATGLVKPESGFASELNADVFKSVHAAVNSVWHKKLSNMTGLCSQMSCFVSAVC